MGLESITLQYEGVKFNIDAKMVGGLSLYNVPMTSYFPSGHTEGGGIGYDADKQVFVNKLIEDHIMSEHYPEEFAKSTLDKSAWNSKWDEYRLEASRVFALLVQQGYIEIKDRPSSP